MPPKLAHHVIPFLWHFIRKQPIVFWVALFTALVWSVNEVLFPYFIKWIINTVDHFQGDKHHIYAALALPLSFLVGCWLIMEISMRLQGTVLAYGFPKFRSNIRKTAFAYVKHHAHDYFINNFAGSIAQKLSSLPTSSQTLVEIVIFTFCSTLVAVGLAFILMWQSHPTFAFILLAWFCVHMGIGWIFLHAGNKRWELHANAVTTLSGKIVDSITNYMSVLLFARRTHEMNYVQSFQQDEIRKSTQALIHMEIMRFFQGLSGLALIFSMIFTLVHGWIQGWVTIGDFSLISMLAFWILGMVWYLSYQLAMFVREYSTVQEALTLITAQHTITDAPNAYALHMMYANIEFKQVKFTYSQQKSAIFEQLSVYIKAGQKVGLVGFSGSGKSTFVNLLLRLYDVQAGEILIDGQNIAKVTQASLRAHIAMIPQDPSLFHRSLMENIRYGRLDATDKQVIEASKLAHCHEFIEKLPEQYDTLVGERGVKLSGGQRQRIAIARAILKNAPILILDEATSSLDSVTEKLIQESLNNLMHERTTLVIAHRLSTLADMDRILVFDKGKIVEEGTQEALLQKEGHFAHLWRMQAQGFLPESE